MERSWCTGHPSAEGSAWQAWGGRNQRLSLSSRLAHGTGEMWADREQPTPGTYPTIPYWTKNPNNRMHALSTLQHRDDYKALQCGISAAPTIIE